MTFFSLEFLIFLAGVLLGLAVLKGSNTGRKCLLLLASYYFYAYWDWRFLSLILLSTGVDFVAGKHLGRTESPTTRRAWLTLSLIVNLGLLGFFKYCNFFIESFLPIAAWIGLEPHLMNIILPVGISFYTFQTLSYTIDVYRGLLKPQNNLLDFALFVAFFPQLVAGPIVRASHFLPQLAAYKPLVKENIYAGFQLFTMGLFKKIFLADRLAFFSDHVFANAGAYDCVSTWAAALAYSLQIYFDFSGYSDMAIGVGRALGYDLGINFNFPYLSASPREFWRRWHISLSTWIRDYLYFPLGGSRRRPLRTYFNLLFSMLLCGLWHGAAWTFVAWGGGHGIALAANRILSGRFSTTDAKWFRILGWFVTMLLVIVGWVLFRSQSFHMAELMLRQMFLPAPGIHWVHPFVPAVLAGTVLIHVLQARGMLQAAILPDAPHRFSPALLFSLLWLVILFAPSTFNPFIYFQF